MTKLPEPSGAGRAARAAAIGLMMTALALVAAAPPAQAAFPYDEIRDIQWCIDQTSQAVRGAIQTYASALLATWDDNYRSLKCKLHQHPPIVISGSLSGVDPGRLQAQYGITRGTGTASDPYVIENWEIAGADTFTATFGGTKYSTPTVTEYNQLYRSGITIGYTTQHFVISKVYVHGFHCATSGCTTWASDADSGIHVGYDAPNVRIENSLLHDNDVGITTGWTNGGTWTITGNDIRATTACAVLYGNTLRLLGNSCRSTGPNYGIFRQAGTDQDEIRGNSLVGPGYGTAIRYAYETPSGFVGNNPVSGWSASSNLVAPSGCSFSFDGSRCYFTCTAGEGVEVSAWSARTGDYPRTRAVCGGVDNYCQSHLSCSQTAGYAGYTEVGTCLTETVRNLGSCNQAPPTPPGSSCSFSGDYGRCYFVCKAGQEIYVSASSWASGDYPRTHATCGGIDGYCQWYGNCYSYLGKATFNDLGICYSETVRNDGYCSAFFW